jgi:hypothetical protein
MNKRPVAFALVSLLLTASLAAPAGAGTGDWKQPTDWKRGSGMGGQRPNALLTGSENANRTNKLTSEINWHRSVGQAESIAGKEGKMILWVNLLGTMSGAT